jgi:hypothetical protein
MGWAFGTGLDPHTGAERPIGYSVPAACDHPGCTARIDRGLAYLCGDGFGQPTDEACGGYFCNEHLLYVEGARSQLCPTCAANIPEPRPAAEAP